MSRLRVASEFIDESLNTLPKIGGIGIVVRLIVVAVAISQRQPAE